ncbi:MAG: hypothetical protein ACJ72W_04735 [Actinoallomurus sp.]
MLAVARSKGGHDRLYEADVTATGLDGGTYDLVIASSADGVPDGAVRQDPVTAEKALTDGAEPFDRPL